MKRPPPAYLTALLQRHEENTDWISEMIRVKTTVPVENQANHIKDKSLEYFEGLADGVNNVTEAVLCASKMYSGFFHVGESVVIDGKKTRIPVLPSNMEEYRPWRRRYLLKGA